MVDPKQAGALLKDVAGVEKRAREYFVYWHAGDHLILWGIIWMAGYASTQILAILHASPFIAPTWIVLVALGAAMSVGVVSRAQRGAGEARQPVDIRPALAAIAIQAFGLVWITLGRLGFREQAAFVPTLFAFVFMVAGLWVGRLLVALGAALLALTLVGYYWSGAWFDLWMAFVVGGTLIAAGFWLRS